MAVKKAAVIGAGRMGQSIARTLAGKGIEVCLKDINERTLKKSMESLKSSLNKEIERWGITETEKKVILSRIIPCNSYTELENVELVIESIQEDFEKKSALLKELDAVIPDEVVFITVISTLSVTELAANITRGDKLIGARFFYPVHVRPLIEVVRGYSTSDETYNVVKEFAQSLDKTTVNVFESPGYITTRVILPMINEAMNVVMEGVATAEDVDTAMKLGFDLPQGPLELADEIGLDEIMRWLDDLFKELGDVKFRPCPLLRKLVRARHLGVKTGKGFFEYKQS